MAPKMAGTLKATGSASALKAAGNATLKGDLDSTLYSQAQATLKLGPGRPATMKPGSTVYPYPDGNLTKKHVVQTVWDAEERESESHKKLASLTGNVQRMASVFEGESRARAEQRQLMDELHEDQMARLGEISAELDASMADLARNIDEFMTRFRGKLSDTYVELHNELRAHVAKLTPRLDALAFRGEALKVKIDEEREGRIRENAQIVAPLKEQIQRIALNLEHEQAVRQARNQELKTRLSEAVAMLESGVDAEIAARQQRQGVTIEEWSKEQERLLRRQGTVEETATRIIDNLLEEGELESKARIAKQDPVVSALTKFINEFFTDTKEKAEMGQ